MQSVGVKHEGAILVRAIELGALKGHDFCVYSPYICKHLSIQILTGLTSEIGQDLAGGGQQAHGVADDVRHVALGLHGLVLVLQLGGLGTCHGSPLVRGRGCGPTKGVNIFLLPNVLRTSITILR